MFSRAHAKTEHGFTIIEVMVAATLLLIGMLGTLALVDTSEQATAASRAREGATNLAREVVEHARSVQYNQITDAGLPAKIQAVPGLDDAPGGSWQVVRRNFTYTIATSVCAIDDPRDGLGDHSGGGFCAGPSGTDDGGPQDFKQVTADVSWTQNGTAKSVRRTSLITTNGTADAPMTRNLVAVTPTFADPSRPLVTSTGVTSVTFEAEASASATRVIWSVDGVDKGNATLVSGKWRFTLPIPSSTTAMTDGDYEIGTRAVDTTGAEGPTLMISLRLLRTVPTAPPGLNIGNNKVRVSGSTIEAVELEWQQNSERNVRGYRVYRPNGTMACPTPSTAIDKTPSCVDTNPVYGTYSVKPIYENSSGTIVEGAAATASITAPIWSRTFYFTSAAASTNAQCAAAGGPYTMSASFAGGTETYDTMSGGQGLKFCAAAEGAARTLQPGTTVVTAYARNLSTTTACPVDALIGYNLDPAKSGTVSFSIPPNTTTPVVYTLNRNHGAISVVATDRPTVHFTTVNNGACTSSSIAFNGTSNRSNVVIPGPDSPPYPPTGLTATPTANGLQLSWTAPAGATVTNYRIYRTGTDVTQRYDVTGDTSTTYVDPDNNGARQYWVTAVNSKLGESTPVGPVTG